MKTIGSFEAKNRLSELLDLAERGEEFAITKYGRVVARLGPPKQDRDVEAARAASKRMRERAKRLGIKFDWEEWKSYRDFGRK
jgi:prevent-host-death family protein